MHKIGYKFGTVDLRVAILQREDIIRWRGRFLKRLRENERDPNKKKLYTQVRTSSVYLYKNIVFVGLVNK